MNRFINASCAPLLLCVAADKPTTSVSNLLLDSEFATVGKVDSPWKLQLFKQTPGEVVVETVDGKPAVVITVPAAAPQNWHVQFQQGKLSLKRDQKYKFELTAKAEADHALSFFVQQVDKPNAMLGLNDSEKLSTESKTVTREFVVKADEADAKISLALSGAAGKVTITAMSLTAVDP